MWGCEKKTQMSVPTFEEIENGEHNRYWNCPMKFIPESLYKFFMLYNYHKDFPSAQMPSFPNLSNRFLIAYKYYEMKLNEFKMLVMEQNHG